MGRQRFDREREIDVLHEDSLRERLKLAEDVAVLFGWTEARGRESARDKAVHDAWTRWANYVGSDRTGPDSNARLDADVKAEEARWREGGGSQ